LLFGHPDSVKSMVKIATFLLCVAVVSARRVGDVEQHEHEHEIEAGLYQGELPDCLSIPFYASKCPIEASPGGCFRKDGLWGCWTTYERHDDNYCRSLTLDGENMGYTGACEFKKTWRWMGRRWQKVPLDLEDVADCFEIGECLAECHPATNKWAACYVEDKNDIKRAERCMCAMKNWVKSQKDNLLNGQCYTMQIGQSGRAFSELCKFPDDGPQTLYKCESIPTYNPANAATICNPGMGANFACFHTDPDQYTAWQCGNAKTPNPSCRTTLIQGLDPPFYDGACIYKDTDGYEDALTYEEP